MAAKLPPAQSCMRSSTATTVTFSQASYERSCSAECNMNNTDRIHPISSNRPITTPPPAGRYGQETENSSHHNQHTNNPMVAESARITGKVKKISDPVTRNFQPSHRRAKSGDSYVRNISKPPNIRPNQPIQNNRYQNVMGTRVNHFEAGSQNYMRPHPQVAPQIPFMPSPVRFPANEQYMINNHEQYFGNNADHYMGDNFMQEPTQLNAYVHHHGEPYKTNKYLEQVQSFIKLTEVIEKLEKDIGQLTEIVNTKELESNSSSSVERNHTREELERLKYENSYLMKEIRDMDTEIKEKKMPGPWDDKPSKNPAQPQPVNQIRTNDIDVPINNIFEINGPDNLLAEPMHDTQLRLQPKPLETHYTNPFTMDRTIADLPSASNQQPNTPIDNYPNGEQWRCGKCTFDNIYLSECEICGAPRSFGIGNR